MKNKKKKHVVLIGDDTDLLVLLLYHSKELRNDIYLITNVATKREIIWSVKESITALTTSTIKNLPFVHAFLGCDTTSRIQGLGKSI